MSKLPGMAPFWERFPDVAARETRGVIVSPPQNPQPGDLPSDTYVFGEFYCDDPACDCRRVLFHVWAQGRPNIVLATINYGWESEAFYTRWMHGDRKAAREIRDANLDPLNPQSEWSPLLLRLFQQVIMADPAYIARLGRHYAMFKDGSRLPAAAAQADTRPTESNCSGIYHGDTETRRRPPCFRTGDRERSKPGGIRGVRRAGPVYSAILRFASLRASVPSVVKFFCLPE